MQMLLWVNKVELIFLIEVLNLYLSVGLHLKLFVSKDKKLGMLDISVELS